MTKFSKLNITLALATSVLLAASGLAFAGKSGGGSGSASSGSGSGSASSGSKSSSSGPTNTGASNNTTTGHTSGKRIQHPIRVVEPKSKTLDRPGLNDQIKNLESQQEEVRNKRQ
jgi:hypothetical protein